MEDRILHVLEELLAYAGELSPVDPFNRGYVGGVRVALELVRDVTVLVATDMADVRVDTPFLAHCP